MERIERILLIGCVLMLSFSTVCFSMEAVEPKGKVMLFDGKSFAGLVRILKDGQGDVDKIWSIKEGGVLSCTGEVKGYIRTDKSYRNYKLCFEYRWTGVPGNSGVLLHITGEDKVWPKCLESQGEFKRQGDFITMGEVTFDELKAGGHRTSDGKRVYKYGRHNEKRPGQWNEYEVWCVGDTVRPYVNGKLMNEATGCSVSEGTIGFQSEGVGIEFRNIYLEPVEENRWPVKPCKKIELFNGKNLEGWVRFVDESKGNAKGKDNDKATEEKFDIDKVWTVRDGVIHCVGRPYGYIRTVESYADYKLHVEWRWPNEPTNSGVLLHKTGLDRVWPMCIEAQLQNQRAGDFWLIEYSTLKVGGKQVGPKDFANVKKKHESNEKEAGQWNSYDIICEGDTVTVYVNGLLQNQGTDANPHWGPICLQSEGSAIEFRNVYLEPIEK